MHRPPEVTQLPPRRPVPFLDVEVTPQSAAQVASLALTRARAHEGLVIGNLNLHGVYMFHTNAEFRAYCDSCDLVLIDGAPIAWAAGVGTGLRVGSTDWLDELMPAANGITILAIGGTPRSASAAEERMNREFPAVRWIGADGYNRATVSDALHAQIKSADIVLVGMGMPLQEGWLLANESLLEGKVVANVGGCIDYYAGTQHLAPRWMGRAGVEWIFRLARDPKRLAYRYLFEPLKLLAVLVARRVARSGR